jgi:hypothetical protein
MRTPGFTIKTAPTAAAPFSPRRFGFQCGGPFCACSGDADCNDLFTTGLCGASVCFVDNTGGVVCICVRQ